MWVRITAWPVTALVSLSKTLNHNCFVLQMGRKAVGPVCCVMHVKEPRTLIVKEKELSPVFLDSRLEHPAGWICARYKSSVLLLLLLLLYLRKNLLGSKCNASINIYLDLLYYVYYKFNTELKHLVFILIAIAEALLDTEQVVCASLFGEQNSLNGFPDFSRHYHPHGKTSVFCHPPPPPPSLVVVG